MGIHCKLAKSLHRTEQITSRVIRGQWLRGLNFCVSSCLPPLWPDVWTTSDSALYIYCIRISKFLPVILCNIKKKVINRLKLQFQWIHFGSTVNEQNWIGKVIKLWGVESKKTKTFFPTCSNPCSCYEFHKSGKQTFFPVKFLCTCTCWVSC